MPLFLAIIAGYIVSCLMVAAFFTFRLAAQGPASSEIGYMLGGLWAMTLKLALPGFVVLRVGMSASTLTGLLAFMVAGTINGIFVVMLVAGRTGLGWQVAVIGAFAGLTAGLTERLLTSGSVFAGRR